MAGLTLIPARSRAGINVLGHLNNLARVINLHFTTDEPIVARLPDQHGAKERLMTAIRRIDEQVESKMEYAINTDEWCSGEVFSHRIHNYVAVVIGWDSKCAQSEQWIRAMRVDQLEFGRDQPFCHVVRSYILLRGLRLLTPSVMISW